MPSGVVFQLFCKDGKGRLERKKTETPEKKKGPDRGGGGYFSSVKTKKR